MKIPHVGLRAVAIASTVATLLVGCGAGDPEIAARGETVFALERDVVAGLVDAPTAAVAMPAFELRLALQALLTEHATLSNEAMRRAIDGGDIADTLTELTRNTDDLTLAMGLVYGPVGASAFDQLWTNHIEFFNNYGRAMASGDATAAAAVRTELGHYEHDFSDFVDVATEGGLDFDTVLHVLHSHVGQLLEQADAWEAGEYDAATTTGRAAFAHMDTIAGALAEAMAAQQPDRFPGAVDDPAQATCVAARLAVGDLIVTGADVEIADRAGDGDVHAASLRTLAETVEVATERIGESSTELLLGAMSVYTESTSIPRARARLLSTEVDRATEAVCAPVR